MQLQRSQSSGSNTNHIAKANLNEDLQSFCGVDVAFGPRIVLSPSFGVTLAELQ